MAIITRSRGILNSSLSVKTSTAGIVKRTKVSAARASISKKLIAIEGGSTPSVQRRAKSLKISHSQDDLAPPAATDASLGSPIASEAHSSAPTSTTSGMLKEGIAHLLKVEPKLAPLIEKHECTPFSEEGLAEVVAPFHSLVSGIISQQVSSAAAKSIKAKFVDLFSEEIAKEGSLFPTPDMVLKCEDTKLRSAGLSGRKVEYIHSLAEHFQSGELSVEVLANASNEDVVKRLVQVRGLGVWSAEMFLMFGLKRMDVFSLGDLGIQRGQAVIAGRDVNKLKSAGGGKWKYMSEADMIKNSEPFKPYRSLYMWYLWKASDVSVESFKDESAAKKIAKASRGKKKAAKAKE